MDRVLMPDNPSIIPHFGLYGEAALTPEPGYVHIEDIETRSSDAGWLIQPHRVITSYSIHYTKLYDDKAHRFFPFRRPTPFSTVRPNAASITCRKEFMPLEGTLSAYT